jgi:serine protease Do
MDAIWDMLNLRRCVGNFHTEAQRHRGEGTIGCLLCASVPLCEFIPAIILSLCLAAPAVAQDARGTLLAPKAFRAAAAKVQPSLVRIEGFGGIAPGAGDGGYQAPGEGPTTGIIISEGGYILTSTFNFLRKPPIITVVLSSGRRHVAQLLGRDETRKICLLKVDGVSDLPVPQFAPRDEIKVGQWAVAIGVGFGAEQPALSAGIISATSRISTKAIQTDANTSPANYGGPLVDLEGRVIGVCVPLSPGSRDEAAGAEWYDSGIGFAVPLDGLDELLGRLKAGETLKHGFLGVTAEPYGEPPTGVQIKELVPDSPAAKAGLEKGDKILSIAGAEVIDVTHLRSVLGRHFAGEQVEIAIRRGDEEKRVRAELAIPPPPAPPMPNPMPMPGQPRMPMPRPPM